MIRLFSRRSGLEDKHVNDGYPWFNLPDGAMVVDVGGSQGAIARQLPSLNFLVQAIQLCRAQLGVGSNGQWKATRRNTES